jgi:integrase
LRGDRNYSTLLEDKTIKRWYDNVARGSKITADVYLRRLGCLCLDLKLTPQTLTKISETELYNLFLDTISKMEQEGYAGGYIQSSLKAVKSWLAHNRIQVKGKLIIRGTQETPSLKEERVPTKSELKRIFLSGDEKARVICALLAHAGLRPESIGNYEGKDGLVLSDLPDISIVDQSVTFLNVPARIIIRRQLSKAGNQYFTFIGDEACEYLKDYLEFRIRQGEQMTSNSPIVTPKQRMKPFIRTANIGDAARDCIRSAGYPWRPYVLRSYFDTQLMLAESKGLVLRDYRQFWMGHKGDIENRYTTNKQKLPDDLIVDMRSAYEQSQEFLQTQERSTTSQEKLVETFRKQLLLVAGFNYDEIDDMRLMAASDSKLQEIVRKKLLGAQTNGAIKQKAVHTSEVAQYLAQGWEYVAHLPDKQVIIRLSN